MKTEGNKIYEQKSDDPNNTRSNTVQQTIRESETRKRNVQHRQQKWLINGKAEKPVHY